MCTVKDKFVFNRLKKQSLKVKVVYVLMILAFIVALFLIFNDELKNVGLAIVVVCQLINLYYIRRKLEDDDKY